MSWATIVGGGPEGRYTIQLDWGEAQKAQLLAAVAAAQVSLTAKIAEQQVEVDKADAEEAAALASLVAFQDSLIGALIDEGFQGGDPAKKLYDYLMDRVRKLVIQHRPVRDALRTLKTKLAQANAMAAYWNNFQASETRPAWCCDRTESASGYVATVEIPGEDSLILIAPGGRAWAPSDGVLAARELMSPAQAFFNAALLPGWQKFLPTYRWGTASDIDDVANTMTVTLGAARSSAQGLDVNQESVLRNVPVSYMTCNSGAFMAGDRVVVRFQGQDWASPRVIGFVDNPRSCSTTTVVYLVTGHPTYGVGQTVYVRAPGRKVPGFSAPAPTDVNQFVFWEQIDSSAYAPSIDRLALDIPEWTLSDNAPGGETIILQARYVSVSSQIRLDRFLTNQAPSILDHMSVISTTFIPNPPPGYVSWQYETYEYAMVLAELKWANGVGSANEMTPPTTSFIYRGATAMSLQGVANDPPTPVGSWISTGEYWFLPQSPQPSLLAYAPSPTMVIPYTWKGLTRTATVQYAPDPTGSNDWLQYYVPVSSTVA